MGEYEIGLDRGVFYPQSGPGQVWNGLISVNEAPEGFEEKVRYIDGVKSHYRRKLGYFAGSIEAFTYPDGLYEDVFAQRRVKSFGMSYRVLSADSYKIHLVYNVLISPSGTAGAQDTPENFNWDFTAMPIPVEDGIRTAHLIVDASVANADTISELENILYGSDTLTARLPLPVEILDIFEENAILRVIDNGDGTFTVIGPDSAIIMLDSTTFQITWPSAVYIDAISYHLSSL